MKDIPSRYNPQEIEKAIYPKWEQQGLFRAEPSLSKKPFTISIPPPNVTGILHMGHALNNTLQDILIRWKRMQGFATLWVPGTDHAGIATQNVVEKKLAKEGKNRDEIGREGFLQEVWTWQKEHGSTIIDQLKRLGSSCDWSRLRFTMDEEYCSAVVEAFGALWSGKPAGQIYQGDYIINWCPRCRTALSDEEAPHQERRGFLYYIKYPVKGSDRSITVATTRPETMLGDVAIAVNPKDKRYKSVWGKTIILPLVGKEIRVIKDSIVDAKFGTGAVKVTPAHDPNDFEMGRRHKLEPVLVMNPDGTMNENAGTYSGMDRFKAREAIVESLRERQLIVKIRPHSHAVGHCYRCNTVVEPYLSNQLFVRMKRLADPAIEAVKEGKVRFYPKRWTKVYLNWVENIRDWCISRQIWWGHRVPLYFCKDCKTGPIFSSKRPERCPRQECGSVSLEQHDDVLDTWFSSWLWPFATLGWPKKTEELEYFYPTSTLVTAPEILFFWVARMIMAGMEFMKEIPFRDIYIHGTVRDTTGRKMSKSLGNTIDPIEVIDEFGADALRYSMISITSTGQDVYLSKEKFHIGRNFANKIWNASRFVLMNVDTGSARDVKKTGASLADRWILSRLNNTIGAVTRSLDNYRFNEAESFIYDFFWHDFCDWYLEMVKPQITQDKGASSGGERDVTKGVLIRVLEDSLKLLHPFMPFVTEALWQSIRERKSIMISEWPRPDKTLVKKKIERNMRMVKDIIISIRNIRSDMDIPYSKHLAVHLSPFKKGAEKDLEGGIGYIEHIARLERLIIQKSGKKPEHCASAILEGFNIFIPLEGIINIEAERARLVKKMEGLDKQLRFSVRKLKDKNFVTKAPGKIVDLEKEKSKGLKDQIKRLKDTVKDL